MTFVRRAFVCLVLVCSSQIGLAQIIPPGGFPPPGSAGSKPRAATLIAPQGVQPGVPVAPGGPVSPLTLQWTQSVFSPLASRPVNYFIICEFDPATQNCAAGSQWTRAVTDLSRVARTVGSQTVAHDYRFNVPSAAINSWLDRQLQWTVGSCETTMQESCTLAAPFSLWVSTLNLRAYDIEDGSDIVELMADGIVDNRGAKHSGQFVTELHAWRALLNAAGTCLTDISHATVENQNFLALTTVGEEIDIDALPILPGGARDLGGRTVVAIYTRPDRAQHFSATTTHPGLDARDSAKVVSIKRSVTLRPAAYARVLVVDSTDSIVEFNETDNRKGECQTLYPAPQATLTVRLQNASAETVVQSQPSGIVCTLSSLSDCTQSYPESSSVTLTAFPFGEFVGWSGCDSVTGVSCDVVMTGDRVVTAEFEVVPNGQL